MTAATSRPHAASAVTLASNERPSWLCAACVTLCLAAIAACGGAANAAGSAAPAPAAAPGVTAAAAKDSVPVAAWVATFEHLLERTGAAGWKPTIAYCIRVGSEPEASPLSRKVIAELARRHPEHAPQHCEERAGRPLRADGRPAWSFSVVYLWPAAPGSRTLRTSIYMDSGPRTGTGWECLVTETEAGWRVHDCRRGVVS